MSDVAPRYALLTKVLDPRHTLVLEDWLEFLGDHAPAELLVYAPDDPAIAGRLDDLARRASLSWRAIPVVAGDDLDLHETAILLRMVAATDCEYLLFVTLDALPYRAPLREPRWLDEVFARLGTGERTFFSACGVTFRGDLPDGDGRHLRTQRFSNNCGLLPRAYWTSVMERYPESLLPPPRSKYHSEWAIELALRTDGRFGLRRIESADWRVFHVQQWDARLFETRALFRRGVGIERYLNRVWEDLPYPEAEFYNYPLGKRLQGRLNHTRASLRRWAQKARRWAARRRA